MKVDDFCVANRFIGVTAHPDVINWYVIAVPKLPGYQSVPLPLCQGSGVT